MQDMDDIDDNPREGKVVIRATMPLPEGYNAVRCPDPDGTEKTVITFDDKKIGYGSIHRNNDGDSLWISCYIDEEHSEKILGPARPLDSLSVYVDKPDHDSVNHPSHYTQYQGLEVIDLTEQMNFNRGNAVKYIARAGHKDESKEVEDLEKAVWYVQREIGRVKANQIAEVSLSESAIHPSEGI